MNRYRSYMDRVQVSDALHRQLMDAAEAPPKERHILRWAGLAACCALVLVSGWAAWRGAPPNGLGEAIPPTAAISSPPSPTQAVQADSEHTLVVESPPSGGRPAQPSSPIPKPPFTDCTNTPLIAICYGAPEDGFTVSMTAEELLDALGGTESIQADLGWGGFGLDGTAYYSREEQLLQAVITGARGDTSFTVKLAPGALPPTDMDYESKGDTVYQGLSASLYYDKRNGSYTYYADYMIYGMGVRFQCTSPDQDTAEALASRVVGRSASRAGHEFDTKGLWVVPAPARRIPVSPEP